MKGNCEFLLVNISVEKDSIPMSISTIFEFSIELLQD